MNLIDLESDKDYILDGKYKVRAGSDYLPVSKQIKKLLQEIARKKQDNDCIKREDAINTVSSLVRDEESFVREYAIDRIKRIPTVDVIEIGKPYKRDKDHVLYFEITQDDYGEEWWTIRRQDNEKVRD